MVYRYLFKFGFKGVGPIATKADTSNEKKAYGVYKSWTKDDWANVRHFHRQYSSVKQIHSKKFVLNEENLEIDF
jgi:hypothetical protein